MKQEPLVITVRKASNNAIKIADVKTTSEIVEGGVDAHLGVPAQEGGVIFGAGACHGRAVHTSACHRPPPRRRRA